MTPILFLLPFEPTFFPKLQVYFADFPYLRYTIIPEAINLEDLMRFTVRNGLKMNNNKLFFMEQNGNTLKLYKYKSISRPTFIKK